RDAFEHFLEILGHLANGNAVTIVPVHAELTTQQAADYLNVSRPYLIGLLEAGKIDYHKVGTHRRIKFADLIKYKENDYASRRADLAELTAEAQRLGLDY
ncbi:MAG: helix-turn-helix domain-containing protein, partial [Gammaproteobacteria bacterium]